jgi:hypothetical protein
MEVGHMALAVLDAVSKVSSMMYRFWVYSRLVSIRWLFYSCATYIFFMGALEEKKKEDFATLQSNCVP